MAQQNLFPVVSIFQRFRVTIIIFLIASIAVILALKIFVIDANRLSLANSLLDALLTASILSFTSSFLLWWTNPRAFSLDDESFIYPANISNRVRDLASQANKWEYIGHTGRFTRAVILPILENTSKRNHNVSIPANFMIISPLSTDACRKYTEYRRRARSAEYFEHEWSIASVQTELLTTIIEILKYAKFKYIDPKIFISDSFSAIRHDASNEGIILTVEDPQSMACYFDRTSRLYSMHRSEANSRIEQAEPLTTPNLASFFPDDAESVAQVFTELFGPDRVKIIEDLIPAAVAKSKAVVSPYA